MGVYQEYRTIVKVTAVKYQHNTWVTAATKDFNRLFTPSDTIYALTRTWPVVLFLGSDPIEALGKSGHLQFLAVLRYPLRIQADDEILLTDGFSAAKLLHTKPDHKPYEQYLCKLLSLRKISMNAAYPYYRKSVWYSILIGCETSQIRKWNIGLLSRN